MYKNVVTKMSVDHQVSISLKHHSCDQNICDHQVSISLETSQLTPPKYFPS